MRRWLGLGACAGWLIILGCAGPELPKPGDEVKLRLTEQIQWRAGQKGALWVALYASAPGGRDRMLDFAASPEKNPVAKIQFFAEDGSKLTPDPNTIELSTRC